MIQIKNACPVCTSINVNLFLNRERVPTHQNLVFSNQEDATNMPRGRLQLGVCTDCGFVYNQAFEPEKLAYGKYYDNTQMCSPFFEEYIQNIIYELVHQQHIQNCRIVDVGCGKGEFLERIVENRDWCNQGFGFDPSYVGPDVKYNGRLQFYQTVYDENASNLKADVIICRHVIEHIPNPFEFLCNIRRALDNSPNTKVFFETPDVEWILRRNVIWDFFYEHCSYFSANSLTTLFQRAGFNVDGVKHVFRGQYLWLEASLTDETTQRYSKSGHILKLASDFGQMETQLIRIWREKLNDWQKGQKVAIWGAGAKGVTFANLLDPDWSQIDSVIDLNPRKQGNFLPGTGHPIISPQEIAPRGIDTALLMNPNYYQENLNLLRDINTEIQLCNLMGDFNETAN